MQTKYVRSHSGLFAIFSAGAGMQHSEMADHIDDRRSMSDAGFVDADPYDEEFHVYGKSLTLGIGHNPQAGKDMEKALKAGKLRLYPLGESMFSLATNAELPGDFTVVKTFEELYAQRVLSRY